MSREKNKNHHQFRGQKGTGLVETLVAVAILGTSVVAFVTALSAGSIAVSEQNRKATAQRMAQSQMEYTKSWVYDPGATSYPLLPAPDNYDLSASVISVPGTDNDIQKITVTVNHNGEEIMCLEGYKGNR